MSGRSGQAPTSSRAAPTGCPVGVRAPCGRPSVRTGADGGPAVGLTSEVAGWTLTATFPTALGTSAVASATVLSRRLAVLEREQVLVAARAQARHPLQSSLDDGSLAAEAPDIGATQLALEPACAYGELLTALHALPEEHLPTLRSLDHTVPLDWGEEGIRAVRGEVRVELTRLTRPASSGRTDDP